jgi:hypothetical protein
MQKLTMTALALSSLALPALAQTAPATNNGARPGNDIGTGSSLPMSNKASNTTASDTHSAIAPNLPSPPLGEDTGARAYLAAARSSLQRGHTGEAQQSLEMAETRLLDRSVTQSQIDDPSASRMVRTISDARRALGDGNTQLAMQIIDRTLTP